MPAIHDGDVVVARAVRLAQAARMLDVPVRATEQYPAGLGPTVGPLSPYPEAVLAKTAFSAIDDPDFPALLPVGSAEIMVAGCEAHVCVLQTVLGLLDAGNRVVVVADAIGSRDPATRRSRSTGPGSTAPRSSPRRWCCSSGSATPGTPGSARCNGCLSRGLRKIAEREDHA